MREENFWCKKPRYSEVRVIARRVIARYDCLYIFYSSSKENKNIFKIMGPWIEFMENFSLYVVFHASWIMITVVVSFICNFVSRKFEYGMCGWHFFDRWEIGSTDG